MNTTIRGMSRIDFLVIAFLLIVSGFLLYPIVKPYFVDSGILRGSLAIVAIFLIGALILSPLWIYNAHKQKFSLKDHYERGLIEKNHYRDQVGERFYQQHHGEDDEQNQN